MPLVHMFGIHYISVIKVHIFGIHYISIFYPSVQLLMHWRLGRVFRIFDGNFLRSYPCYLSLKLQQIAVPRIGDSTELTYILDIVQGPVLFLRTLLSEVESDHHQINVLNLLFWRH